jgi:hypothetical protein
MPQKSERLTYGDGFNALSGGCKEDWENEIIASLKATGSAMPN